MVVKQVNEAGNPELTARLKNIFVRLDYRFVPRLSFSGLLIYLVAIIFHSAEIIEETILDLLLDPIDWHTSALEVRSPAILRHYSPSETTSVSDQPSSTAIQNKIKELDTERSQIIG